MALPNYTDIYQLPKAFIFKYNGREERVYKASVKDRLYVSWGEPEGSLSGTSYDYTSALANFNSGNWIIQEPVACNGVDAKNNPLHFTKDMLKPSMRVTTKGHGDAIVMLNVHGDLVLVLDRGTWNDIYGFNTGFDNSIDKVFSAPSGHYNLLKIESKGGLIWSGADLKLEALNAAVKVAEKARDEYIKLKGV